MFCSEENAPTDFIYLFIYLFAPTDFRVCEMLMKSQNLRLGVLYLEEELSHKNANLVSIFVKI